MNGKESQLLRISTGKDEARAIAYRFEKPRLADRPVFVWFCGFGSEMGSLKAEDIAGFTETEGAGCLRFDYSGHGRSEGAFEGGTIGRWLDDAAAVCDAALTSNAPFVFVGSSMGGWIALLLALRRQRAGLSLPKAIVLIAPAWNMTELLQKRLPEHALAAIEKDGVFLRPSVYGGAPYPITKKLIDEGKNHLFGTAPLPLDCPIRILHGSQDPEIPWRHSLDLVDLVTATDVRLTLVKDGEHRLSRPQDLALLRTMLAELL